jgi:glycosyltransferase involved in cell wall biosynthesis
MGSNMSRICFLNTTRFWGGGEKLHLEYAIKFRALGYEVFIACHPGSRLEMQSKAENIPVVTFVHNKLSYLNPIKIHRLSSFFKTHRIDTLIFSGSSDFKAGSLAARKAGVARIVYLRGLAVPIRNSWINRFLLRDVVTHAIANSEETRRTMLQHMSHLIPSDKVKVIYHGIDLAEYPAPVLNESAVVATPGKPVVIGNAGRLTVQKGQHLLLEIAHMLRKRGINFRMNIAGAGELETALRNLIVEYGLQDYVTLSGFVSDIPGFMKSIDVFVLTSKWEGFGYVLVEAMAAGKPVVAFDITSNPEIIDRDVTGFLVPYPDLITMTDKLDLLINNPPLAAKMGEMGRLRVSQLFVLDDRIKALEAALLNP